MRILEKEILLVCAVFVLLVSCDKHDGLTDENGFGEADVETEQLEDLKLTLDLSAEIKPTRGGDTLKYHFDKNVPAVAIIQSNRDNLICLPCSMTRSVKNPQLVEVSGQEVVFDNLKVDAGKKWRLKLVIGGQWDEESRHIAFEAPSAFAPSEKLDAVTFDQPYISAWQEIPVDEKGLFVTSEGGNTRLALEVETQAVTLAHRIVECETEADVEISKLKLNTESLYFNGYLDLSVLAGFDEDVQLEWHTDSSSLQSLEMNLQTPMTVKPGKQEPAADYFYLWAMPSKSEETKITVLASGYLNNKKRQEFTDITLFESDFDRPGDNQFRMDSRIYIEHTPEVSGPITLKVVDDKKTIIANGTDKAAFVVTQSGVDVTSLCTFYEQGPLWANKLDKAGFTTTRTGQYTFYAEKEGVRSNNLVITAKDEDMVAPDGSIINGTLFCPNVTPASGWYDVNKVGNGNSPQDGLLCWAAAASNMLQWWLDDFKGKGHDLPESVPYGPGNQYRLAIFDTFFNIWTNGMHSSEPAIRWFLEGGGEELGSSSSNTYPNKGGSFHRGGFFRNVLPKELEDKFFESEYVKEYGAYSSWGYPKDPELQKYPTKHERFSHLLIRLFKKGPSGLSVDSHELTVWGCDIHNGLVTRVYITNSDDGGNPNLVSYEVIVKDDWIHLKDYPGKTNRPTEIIRLTGLTGYPF